MASSLAYTHENEYLAKPEELFLLGNRKLFASKETIDDLDRNYLAVKLPLIPEHLGEHAKTYILNLAMKIGYLPLETVIKYNISPKDMILMPDTGGDAALESTYMRVAQKIQNKAKEEYDIVPVIGLNIESISWANLNTEPSYDGKVKTGLFAYNATAGFGNIQIDENVADDYTLLNTMGHEVFHSLQLFYESDALKSRELTEGEAKFAEDTILGGISAYFREKFEFFREYGKKLPTFEKPAQTSEKTAGIIDTIFGPGKKPQPSY